MPAHTSRYRRYVATRDMMEKAQQVRQIRGRKRLESAQGRYYDLDEVFDTLNMRFFHGLLGRPQMSWSGERPGICWAITIPRTMPSLSAKCLIRHACLAWPWSTSSITRCST